MDRSQAARLISQDGQPNQDSTAAAVENELEYEADDATDTASNTSRQPDPAPGVFVLLLTFSAGISGLLFGCTFRASPSARSSQHSFAWGFVKLGNFVR